MPTDAAYKEEIVAIRETPEQTRQRMAQRVKELKEEKERRRVERSNFKLGNEGSSNATSRVRTTSSSSAQ